MSNTESPPTAADPQIEAERWAEIREVGVPIRAARAKRIDRKIAVHRYHVIHSFRRHRTGLLGVLDGTSLGPLCGFGTTGSIAERKSPQPSLYSPFLDPDQFLSCGRSERTEPKLPKDETVKVAPSMSKFRKDAWVAEPPSRPPYDDSALLPVDLKKELFGVWAQILNDAVTPNLPFPYAPSVLKNGLRSGSCGRCGSELFFNYVWNGGKRIKLGLNELACRDCGRITTSGKLGPKAFAKEREKLRNLVSMSFGDWDDNVQRFLDSRHPNAEITIGELLFPGGTGDPEEKKGGWQEINGLGGARLKRRKGYPDWLGYATRTPGKRGFVYNATTMQVVYHRWPLLQTLENEWPIPEDDHRNRILKAAAIEIAVVCRYHWLAQTDEEIAAWLCGRSEDETEPERITVAVNFVRARRRSFIEHGNTLIAKRRLHWASRIRMPARKGKWLFSFSQDREKPKCAYDCAHNCNDRKCRGHAVWLPDPFDWQEPDEMLFARRAAHVQKSSEKLSDSEQAA